MEDLSPIAQPLAQKKMLKKLHKTIKKGKRIIAPVALRPSHTSIHQLPNSGK